MFHQTGSFVVGKFKSLGECTFLSVQFIKGIFNQCYSLFHDIPNITSAPYNYGEVKH